MFKKFKNLLLLFAYTIILTGCMQYDLSMKINDDKSMDFVLIETVEQSLLNEDGTLKNEGFGTDSLPSTIIDFEELKKIFIQKGYTVESYTDPDKPTHQGAKIFKHFEDIDKISKEGEKVEIDFTAITDEIFDDSYFFTVQKGLVYNIYKGSFKIMNEDNLLDPSYSSYLNIKYTLKLPKNSFVESNATTVSDDKTVLTWELDGSKVNNINFTFKMAKKSNLYMAYACVAIIALLLIIAFVSAIKENKKKKKPQQPVESNEKPADVKKPPVDLMASSKNTNSNELTTKDGINLMAAPAPMTEQQPQVIHEPEQAVTINAPAMNMVDNNGNDIINNEPSNNMPPLEANVMPSLEANVMPPLEANNMPPLEANNMPPLETNNMPPIEENIVTEPSDSMKEELMPQLKPEEVNRQPKLEQNTEPLIQETIVPTIIKPMDTSVIENVEEKQIIQPSTPDIIMPETLISEDINYDFNLANQTNTQPITENKPEELKFVNNPVATNADDFTNVFNQSFDVNTMQLPNIPEADPGIISEPIKPQQTIVTQNNNETVISEIVGEPIIDQNKGQQ